MLSSDRALKLMLSSMRLMNSGEKCARTALSVLAAFWLFSWARSAFENPSWLW
jgi:hypothetical protein